MKKTQQKKLIVYVVLGLALACAGCQQGGGGGFSSCIQPCATHSEADKELSGKLGAKLAQVNVDANLEASYKNIIKNDYPALSDTNARLCLELRAIECYKEHKVIDQATAQRMAEATFQDYRSRNGVAAIGGKARPLDKRLIRRSPDANTILAELREFNLAD
jgi:hypothetical protein